MLRVMGRLAVLTLPRWIERSTLPGEHAEIEVLALRGIGDRGRVLLHFHGGAFVAGVPEQGFAYGTELIRGAGARFLSARYRVAPEHPHPAALEDALAAYRAVLDQGIPPERIVLVGESAGGNLVLATLVALRDAGEPLPAGGMLHSPWLDLTHSGASHRRNRSTDPMIAFDTIAHSAKLYAGGAALDDPLVSPLFADLRGLPPLFFTVSRSEMLYDDVVRAEARLREAGVEVEVAAYDATLHAFAFIVYLPEARDALRRARLFLERVWA